MEAVPLGVDLSATGFRDGPHPRNCTSSAATVFWHWSSRVLFVLLHGVEAGARTSRNDWTGYDFDCVRPHSYLGSARIWPLRIGYLFGEIMPSSSHSLGKDLATTIRLRQ